MPTENKSNNTHTVIVQGYGQGKYGRAMFLADLCEVEETYEYLEKLASTLKAVTNTFPPIYHTRMNKIILKLNTKREFIEWAMYRISFRIEERMYKDKLYLNGVLTEATMLEGPPPEMEILNMVSRSI